MEINLGIIEDEMLFAVSLSELLKRWAVEHHLVAKISIYSSRLQLLSNSFLLFDAIFMDIELNQDSGIEIAKILRQKNYLGEIIFLTVHKEYVFKGYAVHALDYLIKPVSYPKLNACLEYVLRKISNTSLIYHRYDEYRRIPYHEIFYFSSQNQYIEIHTKESTYKQIQTLKKLILTLPPYFVQCHRTIIVNIDYVKKIDGKDIILFNNDILPISNTYLTQVRDIFCKALKGETL